MLLTNLTPSLSVSGSISTLRRIRDSPVLAAGSLLVSSVDPLPPSG